MRKKLRSNILYPLALLLAVLLGACDKEQPRADGAMDMASADREGDGVVMTEDLAFLLKPTNSSVVSSVATTKPQQKTVQATVEMEGIITYDPRRIYTIPARVGGRIEQLFVKYNFQPISKGQKLLEIYSPDLVTAQQELLYLVQSAPEDKQLIEASKQKLRLLGATDAQINRLIRTGEASYTFAVYSPYDGYVIGLNTAAPAATASMAGAAAAPAGGGMGGMGSGSGSSPSATTAQETVAAGQGMQLREGSYVSTGLPLLQVVNPTQLWAEFNIPAGQVSALAKGAAIQITFPQLPDEKLDAKVDFLQPFYQEGENFAKVRVYLPGNRKPARVGQLVSAKASYTTAPALWVPKAAVLDIGTRSVAFTKSNGVFQPVAVTAGVTEGGQTQILEGLAQDDVIAANAQFLVDSESFIKLKKTDQ